MIVSSGSIKRAVPYDMPMGPTSAAEAAALRYVLDSTAALVSFVLMLTILTDLCMW